MNLKKLLDSLLGRGVTVTETDGAVRATPGSALTDKERATILANSDEVAALLRDADRTGSVSPDEFVAPLSSIAIIEHDAAMVEVAHGDFIEAEMRSAARFYGYDPDTKKRTMFQTSNGLKQLSDLTSEEVLRFEANGKLSTDEVRRWAATKRR